MFDESALSKSKDLEEQWQNEYSKLYGEKRLKNTTYSGIPLKPVYTPSDIEETKFEDIGVPGQYPFTRGTYPLQYQIYPWGAQHGLGYALPEQTRQRYETLCREGMTGYMGRPPSYFVLVDTAVNQGYDPDHPAAKGFVGQCGCSVSTRRDFELLFDGIAIEKTNVVLGMINTAIVGLSMFIDYAERRGIAQEKLLGLTFHYFYRTITADSASFLPEGAFKVAGELIKYCSKYVPRWNTTSINGYMMEEAGASAVQEIAFMLATMIATVEECRKLGVEPDDIVWRFGLFSGLGNDFFEQIAKIRALKRMWAKITKEKLGCRNPRSYRAIIQTQTAGSTFTAQQPLNNIVRAAYQTLAGVLCGSNVIWTTCYDEALSIPTEEAATIALRTQQIILHETNIPAVSDPLGGSYYIEWLTNRIEEEAWKLINKVDEIGYINAWKSGWFKNEIERAAYVHQCAVEQGEKIVVGQNKYVSAEEQKVPVFKVDPGVQQIAVDRVRKWRAERDNEKTLAALANLRVVAERVNNEWPKGGDLMPAVIQAAHADATMGEMMQILKDVYRWGYPT